MVEEKKDGKEKVEAERPTQSAEEAAAQAVAQNREQEGTATLVEAGGADILPAEGDAAEESPETNPTAIAEKYIDTIPEKDREITTPKQVTMILYALNGQRIRPT